MQTDISNLDLAIVVGYFATVLLIGFWISRTTKTGEDLFLGGRSFGWGIIGLSLFASNISSTTLIGLTGAAYKDGIMDSTYEWMSGLPLIIAALIFIPLYLESRITTIPEFLEKRFDRRSQLFFSGVSIVMTIMVEMSGALYAGSKVLLEIFPDLVLWQTTLFLAIIAGLYTAFGGLKAVVYTDAIQAVILIVGCSVMSYMLFKDSGFDWDTLVAKTPGGQERFSVIKPMDADGSLLPWQGILMGVPFLGFWYWSTNQYIIQRALGARDIDNARWGLIFAGFLKVIPLFIIVLPGVMAISYYTGESLLDENGNADGVFPRLITDPSILPSGLMGLVLAGFISAIMSSVDSALNSSSSLVVMDFIKPNKPNITSTDTVKYGRMTTAVLIVIAAIWAPNIRHFDGLWGYLQMMFSLVVPPIAVIFLVGVFFKRGNGHGAFWTLLLGTFITTIMVFWNPFQIHFTITVGFMVLVSTLIFIVVSLMTEAPDPVEVAKYTYRKGLIGKGMEDKPFYKDYRYQLVLLVALIAYILFLFW